MESPEWPEVRELVPHAGDMVLLSRVLSHDEQETVCESRVDDLALFRDDRGNVPAWIGLEIMAQCIAVHGGLAGRVAGERPRIGLLVGSRRVRFHRPEFRAGRTLRARARRTWGQATGLVSFDCSIDDAATGDLLAEARLNCFMPKDDAELEAIL